MSNQIEDAFHIWKIKLELAQEGNSQAIQDINSQCLAGLTEFSFIENNLHDALKNANIKYATLNQTYGEYELYSQVPIFLLLEGRIELKCINMEGDEEVILRLEQKGVIYVSKAQIVSKFGESNVNIVTKFHLSICKNSIFIEINEQSRRKIQNGQGTVASLVGLREENIMKKYMLFPLKYIRIEDYDSKLHTSEQKFYLLEGRACYFYQKNKQRHLLAVYQEGYINPKQFANSEIKLYVFQNSKILIFEEQFIRDDVIAGLQSKRTQHLQTLAKAYEKMSSEEKKKIQLKLINNYKLNKKQFEKHVLGISQNVFKQKEPSQKKISTKNELTSTSSSMKEKCRIRISKKKKIF